MTDISFEQLFEEVQKLTPTERLRMMELVAVTLHADLRQQDDWHKALRATYGLLADDPMERPEQLPLEEREPFE
ncbi:MAG: hypothetical protein LCI00_30230 [Chloroflexi bacterium]|nr:hypothetical protein [Chloroflexota bacterium]MCC6892845.1 hypothetical protein [Anaerolineae bacterium]